MLNLGRSLARCTWLGTVTAVWFCSVIPTRATAEGEAASVAFSHPTITVALEDGRRVSGELRPRTDSRAVWIRAAEANIVLESGFVWEHVRGVRHDGRWLTSAECQTLVARVKSGNPLPQGCETAKTAGAELSVMHPAATESLHRADSSPRVASLHIEAVLANWDADADADGLRVFVTPLDLRGRLVPVDGQLELTLTAPTQFRHGGRHDVRSVPRETHLGRWGRRVEQVDYDQGVAVCTVDFPANVNLDASQIAAWGVLSARLGIPGRGTFDAATNVWLRP